MKNYMESAKLLENLFDKKTLSIIKLFLNKKDQELCLKEIVKYSKVPLASSHRMVNKLVQLEIISCHKTKHLKTYKLLENEKTKFLETILEEKKTLIDRFIEEVIKDDNIRAIILYGKEEKDKANVLIIGENIDNNSIRETMIRIKTEHNFMITHLALTEDQYNQMVAMNLYPAKKDIIFQR